MKKVFIYFALLSFLFLGFMLGTSGINDDPARSRRELSDMELKLKQREAPNKISQSQNDIKNPVSVFSTVLYVDSLNGANDTTALKNRGYGVFRRGGPPGVLPIWFQGDPFTFTSFNGPDSGYVASNYQSTTGTNVIDNWLIVPAVNTLAGDKLAFYSRSILNNIFPDSIKVMYSATGASTPEDPSWVQLAYFFVNDIGVWERKEFFAPSPGANARFAIRYFVIDAGPGGNNSNYIGIDMITVERPNAVDVGVEAINTPVGYVQLPTLAFGPQATVKNFGSTTQFNIPVTFTISGPVNYTNSQVVASLAPGASQVVTFASTFLPTGGDYSTLVYTSLAGDAKLHNDTLKSVFTANLPDYGSGGTYFFANSTPGAAPAPSQPQFCWKDTTGSKNLIVNGVLRDTAHLTGTVDDGFFAVGNLPLGRKIRFMGVDYDSVFIGTNGIIAFQRFVPGGGNWNPPQTGIPGGEVRTAFYALWNDFNFADADVPVNRLSYKINNSFQFIITYDRAPLFGGGPTHYTSLQVVIDIVEDAYAANSRLLAQYSAAGSGAGFLALYNSNSLQTHLVGLQNTSGSSSLTYRFRDDTTIVVPGPLFGPGPSSVAVQFGPNASTLNNACSSVSLTLKAFFEGCRAANVVYMGPVTVYLRNTSGNYEVVDGATASLDATGTGTFTFSKLTIGGNYYIVAKAPNSIETWSANPVNFSGPTSYDFTLGVGQAFGNNMRAFGSVSAIYVGDVTFDDFVDAADLSAIDNDLLGGGTPGVISGLATDLNCDDFVDASDLSIADNNLINGVGTIRP